MLTYNTCVGVSGDSMPIAIAAKMDSPCAKLVGMTNSSTLRRFCGTM